MCRVFVIVLLGALVAGVTASQADTGTSFDRYQVILTRKPFGEPPPEPTPPPPPLPPPTPQAPLFTKELRMCSITESDSGIRVGILNLKTQASYVLEITADQQENDKTQDGIELVDASFQEEWAKLKKDDVEDTLFLHPDKNPKAAQAASATTTPAAPSSSTTIPYREQLRKRRESIRRMEVEPPKMTGVELEKHLRSYNLELIRAGGQMGPPLPIELTPEEDAQLVKEGVLPPLEGKPLPPAEE